jgi:hypothetical protein
MHKATEILCSLYWCHVTRVTDQSILDTPDPKLCIRRTSSPCFQEKRTLTLHNPAIALYNTKFKTKKILILPTYYIDVFGIVLRTAIIFLYNINWSVFVKHGLQNCRNQKVTKSTFHTEGPQISSVNAQNVANLSKWYTGIWLFLINNGVLWLQKDGLLKCQSMTSSMAPAM